MNKMRNQELKKVSYYAVTASNELCQAQNNLNCKNEHMKNKLNTANKDIIKPN